MGYTRWTDSDWKTYATTASTKTIHSAFTSHTMKDELNPAKISMRESRDSVLNPNSTAIILGFDVTGSMGHIAHEMQKDGIGKVMEEIFNRNVVTDPHISTMAIGDAYCDRSPLQVTQFEPDLEIAKQLTDIYLEGGGGGNRFESYNLPWVFAALKTSIDCFEKRGKKGYLFTIGDEEAPQKLTRNQLKEFLDIDFQTDISPEDALSMAERMYHVFHIVVEQGSHCRHVGKDVVLESWKKLLGQRVLPLSDYNNLPEVIISAIEILEGKDRDSVVKSWSGTTSLVVAHATKDLTKSGNDDTNDVVLF